LFVGDPEQAEIRAIVLAPTQACILDPENNLPPPAGIHHMERRVRALVGAVEQRRRIE
jgi:predicted hotdog family 3-hydroxylacyl-ACP dehydratase